jgi:hypothetical protein
MEVGEGEIPSEVERLDNHEHTEDGGSGDKEIL